jgi:eukaryotic-like serine/threonine-protein kinase
MGAIEDDSESERVSGHASSLAGVSSDFEDSLLRRVAEGTDPQASDPGAPAIGSVLGGKYRLERLIGRGGMGFVFAARHLTTGRPVAIKWMMRKGDLDQQKKRFVREARAAGRIRHRNVIDIYDVVSDEASTYLVIELLEGESLRSRLRRGRLDTEEAVRLAIALLEGLSEAHRQGVIHRDLKPENIFLCTSPPCTKILDFGISVLSEARPSTDTNLTRTGYFVGTPVYTPLERLREKQPFDHRVDLYSVGVILYEVLTGALPFSGKTPSELAYQLAVSEPQPPRALRPDLLPALEAVVLKALSRDPDERFGDAQEFIDAVHAALVSPPEKNLRRALRFAPLALVPALAIGVGLAARSAEPASPMRQGALAPSRAVAEKAVAAPRASSRPSAPDSIAVPGAAALQKPTRPSVGKALRPVRSEAPAPSSSAPAEAQQNSGSAELTVVVFPYGDVWVDGRRVGSSPSTSKLSAGSHRIAGGRTSPEREATVVLAADESRQVVLSLTKTGATEAESKDPGAPRPGNTELAR